MTENKSMSFIVYFHRVEVHHNFCYLDTLNKIFTHLTTISLLIMNMHAFHIFAVVAVQMSR